MIAVETVKSASIASVHRDAQPNDEQQPKRINGELIHQIEITGPK